MDEHGVQTISETAERQISHGLINSKLLERFRNPECTLTRVFYNTSIPLLETYDWNNFTSDFYLNLHKPGGVGVGFNPNSPLPSDHIKKNLMVEVPFALTLDDTLVMYIRGSDLQGQNNIFVFFEFYDDNGDGRDYSDDLPVDMQRIKLVLGAVCSGLGGESGGIALLDYNSTSKQYTNYLRLNLRGFELKFRCRNTLRNINNSLDTEGLPVYHKHLHKFEDEINFTNHIKGNTNFEPGNIDILRVSTLSSQDTQKNYMSGDTARTLLSALPYNTFLCRESYQDDQLKDKLSEIEKRHTGYITNGNIINGVNGSGFNKYP